MKSKFKIGDKVVIYNSRTGSQIGTIVHQFLHSEENQNVVLFMEYVEDYQVFPDSSLTPLHSDEGQILANKGSIKDHMDGILHLLECRESTPEQLNEYLSSLEQFLEQKHDEIGEWPLSRLPF